MKVVITTANDVSVHEDVELSDHFIWDTFIQPEGCQDHVFGLKILHESADIGIYGVEDETTDTILATYTGFL